MTPTDMCWLVQKSLMKTRQLPLLRGIALTFNRNHSILISVARRFNKDRVRGWHLGISNGGVRYQDMDCGDWTPIIEVKRETDEKTVEVVVGWLKSAEVEAVGLHREDVS